ncbi:MAG: cupin domain-containing protein [Candidatus Obscuribacter sp.]|nr:cupin domain-containing protein [Candidatus Obscuribacter sp.]
MEKFNLQDKFALFTDHWKPKVVASLNEQELKLVKLQGEFPWHLHEREDELFLVWRGKMRIEFRDKVVHLEPGDGLVVPQGIEHRSAAEEECEVLVFEPRGTRNTGNLEDEKFTAHSNPTI